MRTLGLIGGMTWHSTVDYYRLINQGVQDRLGGTHSAEDPPPLGRLRARSSICRIGESGGRSAG